MTETEIVKNKVTARIAAHLHRLRRDEDGTMVVFALFLFVIMLMFTGMAVDFMRVENTRTKVQSTVDRAVLAAADLDQTRPPVDVVNDYMNKAGLGDALVSAPVVNSGLNYRTVTANARVEVPMLFSGLARVFDKNANVVESMTVPASSQAEERVSNVEISLVVDISGSMSSNSKIQNLRAAATEFVETVLDDTNEDLVSVSLIPYSEHVNAGPLLYNRLSVNTRHNYSHCIELPDSIYGSTVFPQNRTYEQMQFFQWNYDGRNNSLTDTVCPRWDYERITPWSQNLTTLKSQIAALQPRAGTQIHIGMKWGVALLDPGFRNIETALINSGNVDSAFAGRPKDYADTETLKFVILMTDGENSTSQRIQSWAYDTASEYQHWYNYNFNYYLSRYVNSRYWSQYYYQKYTKAQGDNLLDQVCDAAKAAGIVVWTIGFEVEQTGADVMQNCASSPSHFFRVEGVEISEAFDSIASQINNLRLTQ